MFWFTSILGIPSVPSASRETSISLPAAIPKVVKSSSISCLTKGVSLSIFTSLSEQSDPFVFSALPTAISKLLEVPLGNVMALSSFTN